MKLTTNWVIIPVRSGPEMTRTCIKSVLKQDIPVNILVVYNSTHITTSMKIMQNHRDDVISYVRVIDKSVAACWNLGLSYVFDSLEENHCLVINNDTELRPDTYSRLLTATLPFVTCVGNGDRDKVFPEEKEPGALVAMSGDKRPHPDFSCFLMHRDVWDKTGPFDEGFTGAYCEDSDYHVRMHMAGIDAWCIDYPFYHVGSGTIKTVDKKDADEIGYRAGKNREYFREKWGFGVGTEEYYEFFRKRSNT